MSAQSFHSCAAVLAICATSALAAETLAQRREGVAAFGDWRNDAPGVIRRIESKDMPAPYTSAPSALRVSVSPAPQGASLRAPQGFSLIPIVANLSGPRVLRFAPNGDLFVAESDKGQVRALRLTEAKTKPIQNEIFAHGLDRPYGLAFYPPGPNPQYLYVANQSSVVRYPYRKGALTAQGDAEVVIANLPAGRGHWTRDIVFSPDGAMLYVAVGSKTNAAEGQSPLSQDEIEALEKASGLGASGGPERDRADVLAFDPDGGHRRVFATGLRNCSGLAIRPETGEPWCVVNERDMLGDDLPPDYATRVTAGAFYGWPWYYIGAHEDPRHAKERPDLADKIAMPDFLIQPHSAPLGIAFYQGAQFPKEYRGDAFVALHGSWNRSKMTGYKIIRLKFKEGAPTDEYEDFVTGFVVDDSHVWGRPVSVVESPDGALLFSDDGNGTIWRIEYRSEQ